jgi:cytochrome b561
MNNAHAILYISLTAFLLNLPFGYLRNYTKKFSWQWFLCIHAPIPLLAYLRISSGVHWKYILLFLILSILGQVIGARLIKLKRNFRI